MYAKHQLTNIFTNKKSTLNFQVGSRQFTPNDDDISVSDVIVDCEQGMKSQDSMCGK